MTDLTDILIRQIRSGGPISIAEYMQTCLLHPQHGYYATRDPFGQSGDFITAPEISQMFGELLGLALAQVWMDQGSTARINLVELGPGRGTLMRDMLRATRQVPGFSPDIHLIEASPTLREIQKQTLAAHLVTWHDSISTVPDGPLLLVANEFFDALPIRQFMRQGSGWAERRVACENGKLSFGLTQPVPVAALADRLADTSDGQIVEICPSATPIVEEITTRIAGYGGAGLIADYGSWRSLGDTFQAVRNHQPVDPLATPGSADLTAHVDFEALARAARCKVTPMVSQGLVLERLGITQRAQVLARSLTGPSLQSHIAAHRRLTHAEEMGSLFKMIAFHPETTPAPAGFAP